MERFVVGLLLGCAVQGPARITPRPKSVAPAIVELSANDLGVLPARLVAARSFPPASQPWRKRVQLRKHFSGAPPASQIAPIGKHSFDGPNLELLEAYEARYGLLRSIEPSWQSGAPPLYLAVFESISSTQPVAVFQKHFHYTVVLFERRDMVAVAPPPLVARWALDLDVLYPGVLELDDANLTAEGLLLVNANYPSYSVDVNGQTAFLYAIDPFSAQVLWRAGPLVSRGEFVIAEDLVLCGYGFTDEPSFLFALDQKTGFELARVSLPIAHEHLSLVDGKLHVSAYQTNWLIEIDRY